MARHACRTAKRQEGQKLVFTTFHQVVACAEWQQAWAPPGVMWQDAVLLDNVKIVPKISEFSLSSIEVGIFPRWESRCDHP